MDVQAAKSLEETPFLVDQPIALSNSVAMKKLLNFVILSTNIPIKSTNP